MTHQSSEQVSAMTIRKYKNNALIWGLDLQHVSKDEPVITRTYKNNGDPRIRIFNPKKIHNDHLVAALAT
jgi:hypothetical protein